MINFKNDDSFLRKLVIGAAGTNATIERLRDLGFNPIELERGSTGFKIWKKIKIKRVRVPDILCLNTGVRFESRGKTKLEISMSHSVSDPRRAWNIGLRDDDFVSIVQFRQDENDPINVERISPVHFIKISDMGSAFSANNVKITRPKGVEEGSEIRVIWPSASSNLSSTVTIIEPNRVLLSGERPQRIMLSRGSINLVPQVELGQSVEANQIIASAIPVYTYIDCPVNVSEDYFVDKLTSINLSERYAAAKALRYRGYSSAHTSLTERMNDNEEDIYVRLEAAAALASHDDRSAWNFLSHRLNRSSIDIPLETQLETIIVLSEIDHMESEQLIIQVLQNTANDEELRAGAAWALGQFISHSSADALVSTFNLAPINIKIEAARALLNIAKPQIPHLLELIQHSEPKQRDGIAWVLARIGNFEPVSLLNSDNNLRQWLSYIVGYGKEHFTQSGIEALCNEDAEVYFATSVLWQIVSSWVNELKEY